MRSFLIAYALAWAGGAIAYTPFLTLLLPMRFSELAGADDVVWLARCATLGGLAASLSNILWGWASDRWPAGSRQRLRWSAAGLLASLVGVIAISRAHEPATLVAAVVGWQVALNLLLAPLAAHGADRVPDAHKGELGGLLSFAPAVAALSITGVAAINGGLAQQLALISLLLLMLSAPLFTARPTSAAISSGPRATAIRYHRPARLTLSILWLARLFVQVAEGLLFLFIFYFLRSVSQGSLSLMDYAWTNAAVQLLAVPVALFIGRLSDRRQRRKAPLLATLALITAGLAGMASAHSWWAVVCFFGVFLTGSNSFLALHAGFAMQQLPDPRHFGRDLGLFNLTNTLPALISPTLAAVVIGRFGYQSLLTILAAMMVLPALLLGSVRLDRPTLRAREISDPPTQGPSSERA